jgi:hypothetical protein
VVGAAEARYVGRTERLAATRSMESHPSNRSLWVSVTLIWLMVAGSCNASRGALDLLSPDEAQLSTRYRVVKVMSLVFASTLAVGGWGAWRWRTWGYVATIAALSCLLVLNVWRAAKLGWNEGQINLFCLLFAALLVPTTVSFRQFLNYRAQLAKLSEGPQDASRG